MGKIEQTYEIGQVLPLEGPAVFGKEIPPAWYALNVPRGKDFATAEYLRNRDMQAFALKKTIRRHRNGVAANIDVPSLPGIVYARFTALPHWHVFKAKRLINGVLSRNATPIVIPEAQILRVKGLERALQGLEERQAAQVSPGDVVEIVAGLFEGHTVEISQVRGGIAWANTLGNFPVGLKVTDIKRVT